MFPIGFGNVKVDEKKDEPKVKGPPTACIKKRDSRSYCGREVQESREFMFSDAPHAVSHYKDSSFMRACPDCVSICEADGADTVKHIAPMSTRGEENDK